MGSVPVSELRPFRALRYDTEQRDLGRVLVPPYDVVAPHERALFYDRDPYNAIRLELTRRVEEEGDTDYAEVADTLATWRREGVLRLDPDPSLYFLRQHFALPDGGEASRDGFFALLRLEDYEARVVRPHERTLRGPKADRLKLLRASNANLSPVFFLYEDPDGELDPLLAQAVGASKGIRGVDAAGIDNHLVPSADTDVVSAVRAFLRERPVVIADGHHRYETALAFRDERPDLAGAQYLLGYFANAYAPGTRLLPIHRVLAEAPDAGWRERLLATGQWKAHAVAPPPSAADGVGEWLRDALAGDDTAPRFVAAQPDGQAWCLRRVEETGSADAELSIRVIHDEVLDTAMGFDADRVRGGAVAFPKSAAETARMIRDGEGALALFLRALGPDDVFSVTEAGEVLPQKSTYFFPKLPSGLLFRTLDEGAD